MDRIMNITEFLLARIAEDEAIARAAIDSRRPGSHWTWESPSDGPLWLRTVEEYPTSSGVGELPGFPLGYDTLMEPVEAMPHIARHDPARVLAECAAKRAIIKQHEEWPVLFESRPTFSSVETNSVNDISMKMVQEVAWLTEREYVKRFGAEPPTAPMMATLAAIYADHPDYQQEWGA
jgi:hypothetical protein